jgi:hypothetical protein
MNDDVRDREIAGEDEREEDRRERVTAADDTGLVRQQELLHVVEELPGDDRAEAAADPDEEVTPA